MNNAKYVEIAETLYNHIEEKMDAIIEEGTLALDYENSAGVLTILCEDTDTQVIISRQQATQQIWVAAKSGGFHFCYDGKRWRCTKTEETLGELLSRVCAEQSGKPVSFLSADQLELPCS